MLLFVFFVSTEVLFDSAFFPVSILKEAGTGSRSAEIDDCQVAILNIFQMSAGARHTYKG